MRLLPVGQTGFPGGVTADTGNRVIAICAIATYLMLRHREIHIGGDMATCWIDFRRLEVYEAGAMLVTWLAFPGADGSEETRGRVYASLCAYALRSRYETEPAWSLSPQPIKPIYALRGQRDINRDLRTLQRRLRDRMVAGRMAIAFLQEVEMGQVPNLRLG